MKDIEAINKCKKKFDDLLDELRSIQQKEKELEELLNRKNELQDSWGNKGLISKAEQALKDAQFPIYKKGKNEVWNQNKRIVAVDAKWISIKEDGYRREVIRYKKSNGWRERARDESSAIDAKLAIAIWEDWNNEQ